MPKKRLAIILGIRPDVIRASLVLNGIRNRKDIDVTFIWSGQHYSDNLKDIFFRELDVASPELELGAGGTTDAEVVASVISKLYPVLDEMRPEAAVFLGDTNTVMGCLAAATTQHPQLSISKVACVPTIGACRKRSTGQRSTICRRDLYLLPRVQGRKAVAEGLNPNSIVVVQNLIVDVLNKYYYDRKNRYDAMATEQYFHERKIERGRVLPHDVPSPRERREPRATGDDPRICCGTPTARFTLRPATARRATSKVRPETAVERPDGGPYRLHRDAGTDDHRARRSSPILARLSRRRRCCKCRRCKCARRRSGRRSTIASRA